MRLARIECKGTVAYAVVEDAGLRLIEGDIFGKFHATDEFVPEAAATLVAPVDPPQIVAIGRNYAEHAAETGSKLPDAPLLFIKTLNTIADPGQTILLPKMAPGEVDFEAELAIVIGKDAKNIAPQDADDYILGYTCANDISARDCQLRKDQQWARGKCFDTFAPLGPWIQTNLDPDNATIRLELNDEIMQDSNTSKMIFGPRYLVSYVSRCMTLFPGSIIMTGTPPGVGEGRTPKIFLRNGDKVTVSIGGIGQLTNPVGMEK